MEIRTLAWFLLLGQIASVLFMGFVISRQIKLFTLKSRDGLGSIRWLLFLLALVIFLGSLVPIVVDVGTVLGFIERSASHINSVGLLYSISGTATALFSALLIWLLYWMAGQIKLVVDYEKGLE